MKRTKTKTAIVHVRVKPELKEDVEQILATLGITTTQAITMFFEQIKMHQGIPFELKIPDDLTTKVLEAAKENENLSATDFDEVKKILEDLAT